MKFLDYSGLLTYTQHIKRRHTEKPIYVHCENHDAEVVALFPAITTYKKMTLNSGIIFFNAEINTIPAAQPLGFNGQNDISLFSLQDQHLVPKQDTLLNVWDFVDKMPMTAIANTLGEIKLLYSKFNEYNVNGYHLLKSPKLLISGSWQINFN